MDQCALFLKIVWRQGNTYSDRQRLFLKAFFSVNIWIIIVLVRVFFFRFIAKIEYFIESFINQNQFRRQILSAGGLYQRLIINDLKKIKYPQYYNLLIFWLRALFLISNLILMILKMNCSTLGLPMLLINSEINQLLTKLLKQHEYLLLLVEKRSFI